MEANNMRIEKVLVKHCEVCNLSRISRDDKDNSEWKGVNGIRITLKDDEDDSYKSEHETYICSVCNAHIQKLNSIINVNKLSACSIQDDTYSVPPKKMGKECVEANRICSECELKDTWKCKSYR